MMDLENSLEEGDMDVDTDGEQESSAKVAQEQCCPVASPSGENGSEGNGQVVEEHQGHQHRLSPLSPTPVPEAITLPTHYPTLSPISSPPPTSATQQAGDPQCGDQDTASPQSLQGHEDPEDAPVAKDPVPPPTPPSPSQPAPPSTSSSIVREETVPPPPGLLVEGSIEVCPPSSQSSMPSPAHPPNFRLLNAPSAAIAAGEEGIHQGRMTRSRSRSVTCPPPQPSHSATPVKRKGKNPGTRR